MKRLVLKSNFRNLVAVLVVCATIALSTALASAAQSYGSGTYGGCTYGVNCSTPITTPAPPTLPPAEEITADPRTVVTFANISPGQTITTQLVEVIVNVKQFDSETNQPLSLQSGTYVALYVDNTLIATRSAHDNNGNFVFFWSSTDNPGTRLSAVVYTSAHEALGRADVTVQLASSLVPAGGGPKITERSLIGGLIGNYGSLQSRGKIANPIKLPDVVENVAVTLPLWIIILQLATAARLSWQAYRELLSVRRIRTAIAREKEVNEQKHIFMSLASHYLNTPFTLINSSVDMFKSVDKYPPESLSGLSRAVQKLKSLIDALLGKVRVLPVQASTGTQDTAAANRPIVRSVTFLVLVVAFGGLMFLNNVFLQVFTTVSLNAVELVVQLVVFLTIATFLFLSLRTMHLRKQEALFAQATLAQEHELDAARNTFIASAAASLRTGLNDVKSYANPLNKASSYKYFGRGLTQLEQSVSKFELAQKVEKGSVELANTSDIDLRSGIQAILSRKQDAITQKKLAVTVNMRDMVITQNAALLAVVLDTLIDNAVKFSNESGTITISAGKSLGKMARISVSDNGIGIPRTKQDKIFQPFNRATSVEQFDYEGMGFSLYLSKVILTRLHGSIAIQSEEQKGTTVTIELPRNIANKT